MTQLETLKEIIEEESFPKERKLYDDWDKGWNSALIWVWDVITEIEKEESNDS